MSLALYDAVPVLIPNSTRNLNLFQSAEERQRSRLRLSQNERFTAHPLAVCRAEASRRRIPTANFQRTSARALSHNKLARFYGNASTEIYISFVAKKPFSLFFCLHISDSEADYYERQKCLARERVQSSSIGKKDQVRNMESKKCYDD
jgi:hypothetical protein